MGLLRTAARTAVITSTATRVHERTSARQRGRWAEQAAAQPAAPAAPAPAAPAPAAPAPAAPAPAAPAPAAPAAAAPPAPAAPAASGTSLMIEQLTRLGELRQAGVLTDEEFEVQKARVLAGG